MNLSSRSYSQHSKNMLKVLRWIAQGKDPFHRTTKRLKGARERTLRSLRWRGLLDRQHKITEKGLQLITRKEGKCATRFNFSFGTRTAQARPTASAARAAGG